LTQFNDLEALVAKMRQLGIKEYKSPELHIVLESPPVQELDDKAAEEQQRIRDEREKQFLQRKNDNLYRAAWGIGPARGTIR
jgi:hypothetical protein